MKNIIKWLEKKANQYKGKVALLIVASSLTAFGVFYAGSYAEHQIKAQTLLGVDIPRIEAKTSNTAVSQASEALKGTPLEEAIPYIEKASKYYGVPVELYLGIAFAESSFKNFPQGSYNPVGLKPDGKLKNYSDWEHSVNYWFHLIKEYYWEDGLKTCKQIERRYVGYYSDDWVNNCQKYFK